MRFINIKLATKVYCEPVARIDFLLLVYHKWLLQINLNRLLLKKLVSYADSEIKVYLFSLTIIFF